MLLELPQIDTLVLEKFRQSLSVTPGDKEQRALVKKLMSGAGALSISHVHPAMTLRPCLPLVPCTMHLRTQAPDASP